MRRQFSPKSLFRSSWLIVFPCSTWWRAFASDSRNAGLRSVHTMRDHLRRTVSSEQRDGHHAGQARLLLRPAAARHPTRHFSSMSRFSRRFPLGSKAHSAEIVNGFIRVSDLVVPILHQMLGDPLQAILQRRASLREDGNHHMSKKSRPGSTNRSGAALFRRFRR